MSAAKTDNAPEGHIGVATQLARFVIIGAACALVDSGIYTLLLTLSFPVYISKSVSFILGTTASYLINRKFTFSAARTGNTKAKLAGFTLVYITTFGVNVGVNQALYLSLPEFDVASGDQFRYAFCWIIAQGLSTLINFAMLRLVVFRN